MSVNQRPDLPVPRVAPARIGVFDSGIGGLTVLKALRTRLPSVQFVYLGDTARLPYGTKSPETITEYVLQNVQFLIRQNVDEIVIACNSASSVLEFVSPLIRSRLGSSVPVTGVIEAGCRTAIAKTRNGKIAVLATRATVASQAYARSLWSLNPRLEVSQQACSLFVSLVEEGWHGGPIVESIIAKYLEPVMQAAPDTLILGCTHFPILKTLIRNYVGEGVTLVDSAEAIARQWLDRGSRAGAVQIFLTDHSSHFTQIARGFMAPLELPEIQLVNLLRSPHV